MTEKERGVNMERLTARNREGGAYYPYCFREDTCMGDGSSYKCDECDFTTKSCEKLAHYEDLAEQGRLLELPCKAGDRFWEINTANKIPHIYPRLAHSLSHCVYVLERIGKTVFLTEQEAQAALEKMKGE